MLKMSTLRNFKLLPVKRVSSAWLSTFFTEAPREESASIPENTQPDK